MDNLMRLKKPAITILVGLIILAIIIKIGLLIASMLGMLIIALVIVVLISIGVTMFKKHQKSLSD